MPKQCAVTVTWLTLLALAATVAPAEPISPLPESPAAVSARVALGGRLFHDPLLSADETLSCDSCHDLATGGDDGRARSVGINGTIGGINAPTVIGTGLDIAWSWDGRAPTLDGQINGPLQSPKVMGAVWGDVIARIESHPEYPALFASAYPELGLPCPHISCWTKG